MLLHRWKTLLFKGKESGDTFTYTVVACYPAPASSGGGLKVWGEIADSEDAELLLEPETYIQASWTTEADTFSLSNISKKAAVNLTGDGTGGIVSKEDFVWNVKLERSTDASEKYGEDPLRSVGYEARLDLPDGVSWNSDVIEAINAGKIRRSGNDLYAEKKKIATVSAASGPVLGGIRARLENGQVVLSWQILSPGLELGMLSNDITLTIAREALTMNSSVEDGAVIKNQVQAVLHYTHAADKPITAGDDIGTALKLTKGNINVRSIASEDNKTNGYMGEEQSFTLQIYNEGAGDYQYDGTDPRLIYEVDSIAYISIENLQKMFAEASGKNLTVEIRNATLAEWEPASDVTAGSDFWINSSNTEITGAESADLTINQENGVFKVIVKSKSNGNEKVYSGLKLADVLREAGYAVNQKDQYILTWKLYEENNEEEPVLRGGEIKDFVIYETTKNTFQRCTRDERYYFLNASGQRLIGRGYVRVRQENGSEKNIKSFSSSPGGTFKREMEVNYAAERNGEAVSGEFLVKSGDVLDYRMSLEHYGDGTYENLPVVSELFGEQQLLVPVEENQDLAGKNIEQYERNGVQYYKLSSPGTYKNVMVGTDDEGNPYRAAEIVVEKVTEDGTGTVTIGESNYIYTGRHTQITWNYSILSSDSDYVLSLNYSSVVDNMQGSTGERSIGSVVWANNKPGSRVYDIVWGGGVFVDFEKKIVEKRGTTPNEDTLVKDDYSVVSAGKEVTYRLQFSSPEDGIVMRGNDFADVLPYSGGFSWTKKNVRIDVVSGKTDAHSILENWEIVDEYNGFDPSEGQQYISWAKNTEGITFKKGDTIYVYVTLTYPEGKMWDEYCEKNSGNRIENTLYVHRFSDTVTHDLGEKGEVLLQKGVYGIYRYEGNSQYIIAPGRSYYNNKDFENPASEAAGRRVVYYVVLYNGGKTRLYLTDLIDQLPKGFKFRTLMNSGKIETGNANGPTSYGDQYTNSILTQTKNLSSDPFLVKIDSGDRPVNLCSARINKSENADGSLLFSISRGDGENSVKYDEERKQCYLAYGDAVVFGYACSVGVAGETDDLARNSIKMQYEDILNSGVSSLNKDDVTVNDINPELNREENKGSCEIKEDGGKIWLMSEVSVSKGKVMPSVNKTVKTYTENGTHDYKNGVSNTATVNWRVDLHNSGALSLTDYTFTDVLPAPYCFVDQVRMKIFDNQGNEIRTYDHLFKIIPRDTDQEKTVQVVSNTGTQYDLPLDGTWVLMKICYSKTLNYVDIEASIERDETGTETMKIRMKDADLSIPEGGYAAITLSSKNPTTSYRNGVYINQAILSPQNPEFDLPSVGSSVPVFDDQGNVTGVMNSAIVNVTGAYATSSEMKVEEIGVSTEATDNLLLSSADAELRYTMSVTNDTKKAMNKLILINNLPDQDDHNPFNEEIKRNSGLRVDLSENPNVRVKVITQDQQETWLDSKDFSVDYKNDTKFTVDDWAGTSSWSGSSTDARAIRVIITDAAGSKIPAGAVVEVSFNAKIAGEQKLGKTAWNSFGYHYGLEGVSFELEAMPLAVGVKTPDAPQLQKKLTDAENDNEFEAPQEETFRFLIYEGEALGLSGLTDQEMSEKLLGRAYTCVDVTVKKGETVSDITKLDNCVQWKCVNGRLEKSETPWVWKANNTYTIIELYTNFAYHQETWKMEGQTEQAEYTFQYNPHPAAPQVLTCTNSYLLYELPNSGGIGIFWHWIGGTLLLMAAAVLLYRNKYAGRC